MMKWLPFEMTKETVSLRKATLYIIMYMYRTLAIYMQTWGCTQVDVLAAMEIMVGQCTNNFCSLL